jgi:hypothetical protein
MSKYRNVAGGPDMCPYSCPNGKNGRMTGCSLWLNCATCVANNNPCIDSSIGLAPQTKGGTGSMVFRGADGKLLEGKQEIFGVELPKVLIVAGVAVAAYFIVKKVK